MMNQRSHQVSIRSAKYIIGVLETAKEKLPKTDVRTDANIAILIISINRCMKAIQDQIDYVKNVNYFLPDADFMKVELSSDVLSLLNHLKNDHEELLLI